MKYESIVFDCDGVLFNSNPIKTEAFYQCALPYGEDAAKIFVDYHIKNGGISRYKKFDFFLKEIVPYLVNQKNNLEIEYLLDKYSQLVKARLLQCDIAEELYNLRDITESSQWVVVSGSDQNELREIFSLRGLDVLFDGGIFGSPDTKDNILKREMANGNIKSPSLFLGDTNYDYEASSKAGLDFIFLYEWSEMKNWKQWVEIHSVNYMKNIKELASL